jgi:hypothetical protein
MIPKITAAALIDPLAVIFSTEIYLIFQEKLHPNVPIISAVREAMAGASAEQRKFVLDRAKMVNELSNAVIEVSSQR